VGRVKLSFLYDRLSVVSSSASPISYGRRSIRLCFVRSRAGAGNFVRHLNRLNSLTQQQASYTESIAHASREVADVIALLLLR